MKDTDTTPTKETEFENILRDILTDLFRIRQRLGDIAKDTQQYNRTLSGYLTELATDIDTICTDFAPSLGILEVDKIGRAI